MSATMTLSEPQAIGTVRLEPVEANTVHEYMEGPAMIEDDTTHMPIHHIFDVDTCTGFMASTQPPDRLPAFWEVWEAALDLAVQLRIQIGDKDGLTDEEKSVSAEWRVRVRELPVLSTEGLKHSAVLLRRAHVVLAYLLHLYIHSLPPTEEVLIPKPISLPLLRVSKELDVPPLLTYADTVLYNWAHRTQPEAPGSDGARVPTLHNLRTQTMFTHTSDEEEFYLCSARIELQGVAALEIMRLTMDETFVDDAIAVQRITSYLAQLARIIASLKDLLLDVRGGCDPEVYYSRVRPWFRGEDSDPFKRKWVFEGLADDHTLAQPEELSGPSAGQSSIVHVLDIYLGVDHQAASTPARPSFMSRMQRYMPRNHRLFLNHLQANPRPLRDFVQRHQASQAELLQRYNEAVVALKEFRDAHMIIAALYILGPSRRAAARAKAAMVAAKANDQNPDQQQQQPDLSDVSHSRANRLKGTGGTDLVKFLKETRTRTTQTILPSD